MKIPTTGYAHVRLTVTDIAKARSFYESASVEVAFEVPSDADAQTREQLAFLFGGVIYHVPGGLFGLRPVAADKDRFDENRTGLDHVSFAVASKEDLDAAARRLDELDIAHEPVKDIGSGYLLEFRDPDNTALELFTPRHNDIAESHNPYFIRSGRAW